MSTMQGIVDGMNSMSDRAETLLHGAQRDAHKIAANFIDGYPVFWGPLAAPARDAAVAFLEDQIGDAAALGIEAVAVMRLLTRGLGEPDALREAARCWRLLVADSLDNIGQQTGDGRLKSRSATYWEGPAATNYVTTVGDQKTELGDARSVALTFADSLESSALALDTMGNGLFLAFMEFVTAITIAIITLKAGPIAGAVGAVVAIAVAVFSLLTAIAGALLSYGATTSAQRDALLGLQETGRFDWPAAVR